MKASETIRRFAERLNQATAEEIEVMAYQSPAVHFAIYTTIRDKNNQTIHPKPNILQLRMSEAFETLRDLGVKVRIICVKPRQVGCSSFASHILYHYGQQRPIEGISISDVKKHSEEIMAKLKDYSNSDHYPWGNTLSGCSSDGLEWSNGTKWTVDTAENPDAGVGGTRQAGHFSEVAKWPQTAKRNDKTTMASVMPSLSGDESVGIAESTPENAAGWMFETYKTAVDLDTFLANWRAGIRPKEQWVKVFAAWHEFPEHSKEVTEVERQQILSTLSNDELKGIARFGWTVEQLAWRRETIATVCSKDPNKFAFYFPSDDESCWLASGTARFDTDKLTQMETIAKATTPETGYLVTQGKFVVFQAQADGRGEIMVWERPMEGMRYLVACDPATGASQTTGADPDRTSVQVWRQSYYERVTGVFRPAKLVARLRAPYYGDDDITGGHIDRLSKWYGGAICALEVNQGLQVLRVLRDAGVPLYKRIVWSAKANAKEEQFGFKLTDKDQRRMLIDGLAAAIREDAIEVLCPDWIREAKAFVRKPNGRVEAASGEHDDDVMCGAMAWEVMPSASEYSRRIATQMDPQDRGPHGWRTVNNVKRGW